MSEILLKPLKAGLIGSGIQASLTPAMHMKEGAAQGLDYDFELIDLVKLNASPADLSRLIADAEARGLAGLNITHPCKQLVIPLLDDLSPEARALGAVNTVVLKDNRRFGHNTDWWGFAESFRRGLPQADLSSAVQLGAGGAGVATAYAILTLGLKSLTVFDREHERAVDVAETMSALFPDASITASNDLEAAMKVASGLIHATPTGMTKYPGVPLPPDFLERRHWVAEIVYFPLETELLRQARQRGCRTLDGGGMAVFQAVGAFRLITGREADAGRMLAHFKTMTT
ncbi:shikimate dehydrogenase [Rhizobium bangladeshense]|uniref:Shikimate dehydrogenase n=1 Tax=Rhizobium bangladeshense TaxID=1138189 RepID=A0ABS7LN25_9HYPH|nr:shikimate dehydrogenase [Rhizobium bangladeshense]MBX4869982.1 shikimate dehydrogenase [Rhizobium bangladeshense]MBX4886304.1 shikimate dehydrogenase [Rhizobium bangladeshense]MBX4904818.1 shikimate dehydrogenase [Rhizobium bangladeshense]MBY3592815.1 shikimate dehydrogenase [Rhizobium bangladeshense]MBY3614444.1 shikimate dehydrogenase [Rhizobium bangladeshense]